MKWNSLNVGLGGLLMQLAETSDIPNECLSAPWGSGERDSFLTESFLLPSLAWRTLQ